MPPGKKNTLNTTHSYQYQCTQELLILYFHFRIQICCHSWTLMIWLPWVNCRLPNWPLRPLTRQFSAKRWTLSNESMRQIKKGKLSTRHKVANLIYYLSLFKRFRFITVIAVISWSLTGTSQKKHFLGWQLRCQSYCRAPIICQLHSLA